jgi:formylglycine-generating enzyme required for sulfatase activity
VSVTLLTDELGAPVGTLDEPVDPDVAPASSLVGTWPRGARVDCSSPPPAGRVCVPGGAYWMGDRRKLFAILPGFDVNRPRLVVVSPFFLDAHEVTAADFRADGKGKADVPRAGADGTLSNDFCTFATTATGRDALPINCITWSEARAYCQRHAGDLPTEAQFEYAASGTQNHAFVWGDDLPACEDAVYSRLGWGAFQNSLATCKPPAPFGGAEPTGAGVRDRLDLPTGTIVDLIGNVHEWERDVWNAANEACWKKPGVYVDPVCTKAGAKGANAHSIRGGAWVLSVGQLDRTARSFADSTSTTFVSGGFRCVATN